MTDLDGLKGRAAEPQAWWLVRLEGYEVNGYYIPDGTMVRPPRQAIHSNRGVARPLTRLIQNGSAPERAEDKRPTGSSGWFGGGVHKCIGLYLPRWKSRRFD